MRSGRSPLAERRPYQHDTVLRHRWRRMDADFTGHEIDRLAVAVHGHLFQIDDAVLAERLNRRAGPRIERHEPEPDRDVQDSLLSAIGPVREAAARQLARRHGAALSFMLAMDPEQLTGCRVERDDGSPG